MRSPPSRETGTQRCHGRSPSRFRRRSACSTSSACGATSGSACSASPGRSSCCSPAARHPRAVAGRRRCAAIVLGTLLGTLPVALSGLPGARTGAPAMVLLRGLFGARLSYLPTVLNIAAVPRLGHLRAGDDRDRRAHAWRRRCRRWGIRPARRGGDRPCSRSGRSARSGCCAATRPRGRASSCAYLSVQLLRHPLPGFTPRHLVGYWAATDTVVAVAISFAPLAAGADIGPSSDVSA